MSDIILSHTVYAVSTTATVETVETVSALRTSRGIEQDSTTLNIEGGLPPAVEMNGASTIKGGAGFETRFVSSKCRMSTFYKINEEGITNYFDKCMCSCIMIMQIVGKSTGAKAVMRYEQVPLTMTPPPPSESVNMHISLIQ
jgi:hypothetical protein